MFEFGSSHNAVRLGLECVLWMEKAKKQRRTIVALGVVLACCTCTSALDPSLDVSQYAHTSWKPSEAFGKGTIWAFAQTPDGYLWKLWIGAKNFEFLFIAYSGKLRVPLFPRPSRQPFGT